MNDLDYKLYRLRLQRKAYDRARKLADKLEERFKATRNEVYEIMQGPADPSKRTGSTVVGGTRFTPSMSRRYYIANPEEFYTWALEHAPDLLGEPKVKEKALRTEAERRLEDDQGGIPGVQFAETPMVSMTKVAGS